MLNFCSFLLLTLFITFHGLVVKTPKLCRVPFFLCHLCPLPHTEINPFALLTVKLNTTDPDAQTDCCAAAVTTTGTHTKSFFLKSKETQIHYFKYRPSYCLLPLLKYPHKYLAASRLTHLVLFPLRLIPQKTWWSKCTPPYIVLLLLNCHFSGPITFSFTLWKINKSDYMTRLRNHLTHVPTNLISTYFGKQSTPVLQ